MASDNIYTPKKNKKLYASSIFKLVQQLKKKNNGFRGRPGDKFVQHLILGRDGGMVALHHRDVAMEHPRKKCSFMEVYSWENQVYGGL